jgi:hypothetical protein
MKFEYSISVTNSSAATVVFHLEPWGEQIEMRPRARFLVVAKADQPGSFEIEYLNGAIVLWAWPTAVVRVFSENEEVGISAGITRPTVPMVPERTRK